MCTYVRMFESLQSKEIQHLVFNCGFCFCSDSFSFTLPRTVQPSFPFYFCNETCCRYKWLLRTNWLLGGLFCATAPRLTCSIPLELLHVWSCMWVSDHEPDCTDCQSKILHTMRSSGLYTYENT